MRKALPPYQPGSDFDVIEVHNGQILRIHVRHERAPIRNWKAFPELVPQKQSLSREIRLEHEDFVNDAFSGIKERVQ